jgi:hypothetical protein
MQRLVLGVLCVGLAGLVPVRAQDGNEDPNAATTQSVLEKVQGGAVRDRAPGRIIDAARARHQALRDDRLAAQRSGDTSGLAPEEQNALNLSGGGNALTNLLGNLLGSGILGGLTSGGSGSDLSGLLGGLTGGGTNTGVTSGTSDANSPTGSNIPSNIPPEAIQLIQDAGIDVNSLFAKPLQSESTADTFDASTKTQSRAQQADQGEPKFVVRWADAMLSTLFTALAVGFQSRDFVNLLADFIRPIFVPATEPIPADQTQNSGTSSDTGDGTPSDPNSIVRAGPASAVVLC